MKNAKSKFIINVRQLTVLLIVLSLLLIFILASTCFTSNKNVLAETNEVSDDITYIELLSERPNNFDPEIIVNKYFGATSNYDDENQELTIDFPDSYSEKQIALDVSQWKKDFYGNQFSIIESESDNDILLKIDNISREEGVLLVEKPENEKVYSTFRMNVSDDFIAYAESNAQLTDELCTSVEDSVVFADAEIVTYAANGDIISSRYNEAENSWTDFSDEEISQLLEITSNREKRMKLETIAANISDRKKYSTFSSSEDYSKITDFIPKFVFNSPGKKYLLERNMALLFSLEIKNVLREKTIKQAKLVW